VIKEGLEAFYGHAVLINLQDISNMDMGIEKLK